MIDVLRQVRGPDACTTGGCPADVLTLRRATPADLSGIMALETAAFSAGWSEKSWADEVRDHWVTVAQASSDSGDRAEGSGEQTVGPVVGVIAMSALLDTAELLRIIVAPTARGAGLGRRLVDEGLKWAADQGADQVFLEVSAGNATAVRLYERCGFTPLSRRRGYYGPGDDAVVYRRQQSGIPVQTVQPTPSSTDAQHRLVPQETCFTRPPARQEAQCS